MTALNSDAISVRDLVKTFGTFFAVKGITFSIKKGEIFGFLGSYGSGKSTTIRMLIFEYVVSMDIKTVTMGFIDQSMTAESRMLMDAFSGNSTPLK